MTEREMEEARARKEREIQEEQEARNRQIRNRSFKALGISVALVGSIITGVLVNDYFENHITPGTIVYELNVHNNTGIYEDGEGHKVTIDNEGHCAVPNDGETEFIDRLAEKMEKDGRYTDEDIEFIREENSILYSADYDEVKEVNNNLDDWQDTVSKHKTR